MSVDSALSRLREIANGIPDTLGEIADTREPNRDRPRVESSDPTKAIDDEGLTGTVSYTPSLRYPHDIAEEFYFSMAFSEYRRPSQFSSLETSGAQSSIVLPLPANLKDMYRFDYNVIGSGPIVESFANAMRSTDGNSHNTEGFIDSLKSRFGGVDGLKAATDAAGGIGIKNIITTAKTIAGDNAVDSALQVAGLADNPFATVAFKGPNFKAHNFSWRLSPNTMAESDTIYKIVNMLRKVAHPELLDLGAGGFYKYPWIVIPKFGNDVAEMNLYKFKPCVISGLNVDYAPGDRPSFFGSTNAPVEIVLEIQLQEIELWRNGENDSLLDAEFPTINSSDFDFTRYPPDAIVNLGNIDD